MDTNETEGNRWLTQAQYDLKAAESSAGSANFEWACFQSQQAAEKALKAFLYLHGKRAVISHSVRNLVRECEQIDPAFAALYPARELDQYYIPTRYPNGLPEQIPHEYYDAGNAKICIAHAEAVLKLVSERAKPSTA